MTKPKRARAPSRDAQLRAEVVEYELLAAAAEGAQAFGPSVAARKEASTRRGELARRSRAMAIGRIRDPVKRLRALEQQAAEDGSWVACAKFAEQAEQLSAELDAQRRADEDARFASLTSDEVLAEMLGAIDTWPRADVERLHAACTARLEVAGG